MRIPSILPYLLSLLLSTACGNKTQEEEVILPEPIRVVMVDTTKAGLVLYFPPTDSIELRCFERPDPKVDSSVVFCCAAAFTVDWKSEPDHDRICGDHVSGGTLYKRPRLRRNTGAFFAKDSTFHFLYSATANQEHFRPSFTKATTAFTQEMLVHQGKKVKTTRPDRNTNQFRALCLTPDGRLCIADSDKSISFGEFVQLLTDAGMHEALYLDMGPGWNYSWYREYDDGKVTWIHANTLSSATNWLVFRQK